MNLLFHQAAVGDFVLTLPIVRAMGDVVVVAPWSKASLAGRMLPGVRPMDIEMWEFLRLYSEGGPTSLSPAVRELFEQAQVIVSFVSTGSDAWAVNVRRLAPQATLACLASRPPTGYAGHVTTFHQQQLREQVGLELSAPAPVRRADPAGPVVVHPGSGGVQKCWPRERFTELADHLRKAGREVTFVIGEAERERWPDADQQQMHFVATLVELHDLLAGASLFIGNDAGPTHVAAQMGLPTVALFGPTDPLQWSPVGPAVTVLAPRQATSMDWLSVQTVLDALPQGAGP